MVSGRRGCFSVFHPCLLDRRVPRAVQHHQRLQRRAGADAVRAVHQSAQEKVRGRFQWEWERTKVKVLGLLQEPARLLPRGVSAY